MAKYFACHYGNIDNLAWLKSKGFNEVGYVIHYGAAPPSPAAIHAAGMQATLNIFNDGSDAPSQMFADGAQFEGYFQAVKAAGWNLIAGEGCTTSVINSVQKYVPYVNYGGDQANNMYAPPWNHPNTGHGHLDYIEIYGRNTCAFDYNGVMGCIRAAKAASAIHLGILIGDWCLSDPMKYINIVDSMGCDTICFWGGYSQSSSRCQGLADVLIGHYGAAKWGSGPTPPGPGPTPPGPPPAPPQPGPADATQFTGFTDIDILDYMAKKHDNQPTPGAHSVIVYLPSIGQRGKLNVAVRTREHQPGIE